MKVLVIRFSSLGDCVLLCPFLGHLRAAGAEEVTVVTKQAYAEVFAATTGVDRVVAYVPSTGWVGLRRIAREHKGRGYTVIDAHNTLRSRLLARWLGGADRRLRKSYRERLALIAFKSTPAGGLPSMLERYAALVDPAPSLSAGGLTPTEAARAKAAKLLATGSWPAVAIAPGSRWDTKRWPEELFAGLAAGIIEERNTRVVLVGDEHDAPVAGRIAAALGEHCIDATNTKTIMETAAVIERCDALVGNDSGLAHVAEAVGVPVVTVFGPTVKEFGYFPSLPRSRVVETDLPCRPCSRNGSRPCLRTTHDCMTNVTVDQVSSALGAVLNGAGNPG